jgi:hypothetical protein
VKQYAAFDHIIGNDKHGVAVRLEYTPDLTQNSFEVSKKSAKPLSQ